MKLPRAPAHFVLIAGASLRGWVWDRVIPHLDGPADAYDLPGTATPAERLNFDLEECIHALDTRLRAITKDVVLVGHSIGAIVAAGVAHRAPEHVRAVAYLGSYLPPPGKPHIALAPWPGRVLLRLYFARHRSGVRAPAAQLRDDYCNDLDEATTQMVLERANEEPPRLFTTRTRWDPHPPAPQTLTYVKLTRDAAVPTHVQDEVIARLAPERVESLDSGHLPMLSRPQELAAVLNSL